MNARLHHEETLQLYAELYHRTKIAALREEGVRLRRELQLRGIDPRLVLNEAGIARELRPRLDASGL